MLGNGFEVRPLGRIVVQGRTERTQIFELLGRSGRVDDASLETAQRYGEALEFFYERRWDACLKTLEELQTDRPDGPSLHLANLTMAMKQTPPPPDWKGEYTRVGKS